MVIVFPCQNHPKLDIDLNIISVFYFTRCFYWLQDLIRVIAYKDAELSDLT